MKPRVLVGLLVAAVAVIALALGIEASRKPAGELSVTGAALPGLLERMEGVNEVRISEAGNQRVATLKLEDAGWTLEEKSYPADADALRKLLLNVARANRVEAKTANPDLYAKLGVEDVSDDKAQGVLLELLGGGEPLALIIGSNYGQGTGTYVRVPSEAQSWLINANVAVEKKTENWLRKDLIDVQPNRVAAVTVTADKDKVEIGRNEAGDFRVLNLPKGREASSDFVADATVGLLQGLRIDDVAQRPADAAAAVERVAKFELVDGLNVEMSAWQADNQTWVTLTADLDEAKAAQHISDKQSKEVADWQANQSAKSASGAEEGDADTEAAAAAAESTAAASDSADASEAAEAPLAQRDPAADREAKMKALTDQLAEWQKAFEGRQFKLPTYKAGNLNRKLEDYLKPKA